MSCEFIHTRESLALAVIELERSGEPIPAKRFQPAAAPVAQKSGTVTAKDTANVLNRG